MQVLGQDGSPILAALTASEKDDALAKIYILDSQADTLKQAQAAAIEQLRYKPVRMSLAPKVTNIAKYPLAISLLCAIGLVMIAEHLAYLIHKPKAGIRMELSICLFQIVFFLIFHMLYYNISICGNKQGKM